MNLMFWDFSLPKKKGGMVPICGRQLPILNICYRTIFFSCMKEEREIRAKYSLLKNEWDFHELRAISLGNMLNKRCSLHACVFSFKYDRWAMPPLKVHAALTLITQTCKMYTCFVYFVYIHIHIRNLGYDEI